MSAAASVVTLVSSFIAAASPAASKEAPPNRFSVKECNRILAAQDEATKTLNAIMAATNTPSCADFKLDRGRTHFYSINLSGKGLTDLSPFRLFAFVDGEIDLSNNPISDVGPLINAAAHGPYRLNLSRTKVKDAALLAKSFGLALVLDGNEIDDPGKLGAHGLASSFSLLDNRSTRGPDYDGALATVLRYYSLFSSHDCGNGKPNFDLAAMRTVLAPKLASYITLKDVSLEAVVDDAKRFYQGKSDICYRVRLESFDVQRRDGQLTAAFAVQYGWRSRDLNVPDPDSEAYEAIERVKSVAAHVSVMFDSTFHIVSYTERTEPRQKRTVVKPTWGTRNMADVVRFLADPADAPRFPRVKIPKGAVLEDAFECITRSSRTKFGGDDCFCKVIFQGEAVWALEETASRGDDDAELYIQREP